MRWRAENARLGSQARLPTKQTNCWNHEITKSRKLAAEWLEAAAGRFYCFALTGEVSEALLSSVLFGEQRCTQLVIDCFSCAGFLKPLEMSQGVQPLTRLVSRVCRYVSVPLQHHSDEVGGTMALGALEARSFRASRSSRAACPRWVRCSGGYTI